MHPPNERHCDCNLVQDQTDILAIEDFQRGRPRGWFIEQKAPTNQRPLFKDIRDRDIRIKNEQDFFENGSVDDGQGTRFDNTERNQLEFGLQRGFDGNAVDNEAWKSLWRKLSGQIRPKRNAFFF